MSAQTTPSPTSTPQTPPRARAIGLFIFTSRWLQAPLYLGLIVAQAIYVVVFMMELWHLGEEVLADPTHLDEASIMLAVLGLIDVVMIANLLIMVIIGGYETFVSKIGVDGHPDQPEWLSHVNANVLKVKLAMAIIGISSIHLLKTFIEVGPMTDSGVGNGEEKYTPTGVMWQVIIHCVFILSALALAAIDRMSQHAAPAAQAAEQSHVVLHPEPGAAHLATHHHAAPHAQPAAPAVATGREPGAGNVR
ncbi:TIGR00645 family protein [Agromyces sp. SYSU K20354]|uniref:TIGR00645 family protein n=1 Tax=Agromyces cavernae TaxID=2898659 RepID=UPI001E401328|nr:TIGR00645 family protein [Agromyces cavernae]MCD2442505.1 TIGR00645 family protein [Agromyces cavernae]